MEPEQLVEQIPEITAFRRAVCPNCRQQAELHQTAKFGWVCEACMADAEERYARAWGKSRGDETQPDPSPVQKDLRAAITPERPVGPAQPPEQTKEAQELLQFIIQNATDQWIDSFVQKEAYKLVNMYGWIRVLESEPDPRVLLRMAVELGYGKPDPRDLITSPARNFVSPGPLSTIEPPVEIEPHKEEVSPDPQPAGQMHIPPAARPASKLTDQLSQKRPKRKRAGRRGKDDRPEPTPRVQADPS